MGLFEGSGNKRTLFESRGGGRHVAFTALRPVHSEPAIMTAENLTRREQKMIRREPVLKLKRVRPMVGRPYPEASIRFQPEAAAAYTPIDFRPRRVRYMRGGQPDIRPMGPYELPDYSSEHTSAEGIGYFGQAPAPAPAPAPAAPATTETSWWKSLKPVVEQAYEAYKGTRAPKATGDDYGRTPASSSSYQLPATTPGMSPLTITLLVGGGVAVVGVLALILLRK